ncbi:MAG: hypothetical protein HN576_05405 [Bacteriovoracaceae bacterium]|jgi:hypothetical protein|nr:hypothetical protein [Bacteriovoracaceae bacterium]
MLISNISDVLATISVTSTKLGHIDNQEDRINKKVKNNKLLTQIEDSTNKIKRETAYIVETNQLPPVTPEFIKHLNILY